MKLEAKWKRVIDEWYSLEIGDHSFAHLQQTRKRGRPYSLKVCFAYYGATSYATLDLAITNMKLQVDEWFTKLHPDIVIDYPSENPTFEGVTP